MAKDPICGMEVNEENAIIKTEYKGKTYYFCNRTCKNIFDKNPDRFSDKSCCSNHSDHCCH